MTTTFFNRCEASDYLLKRYGLRAKPATLAKYATIGGGPPFRLAGRFPVYDPADLDSWAQKRVSPRVHSTCELETKDTQSGAQTNCALTSNSTKAKGD